MMTSWFGSGNDTAGRLKAFIKDHLGVSESASFDSQASMDDVHPFDMDPSSRQRMGVRQDTVIQVDVTPKVPPPRPTPPPPTPAPAPVQRHAPRPPPKPAVGLPKRGDDIYDFRQTDTLFNVDYSKQVDYAEPNPSTYQQCAGSPLDPQLSPPLKAISRRLEKHTNWDKGKDYLASMSDSDDDQSLSSHVNPCGSSRSSSAESRAYFKTFNSDKFNEHQSSAVKISDPKRGQITVAVGSKGASARSRFVQEGPKHNSSQARPLVIPDATDPDDGYGSVENSSSGTASSSDSSSASNTPEQVSPGSQGECMAVARRREAFRRSTKKKTTPSVGEKLRKLCSGSSETPPVKENERESREIKVRGSSTADIERCPKCCKQKGVPHLVHMYEAESICLCESEVQNQAGSMYNRGPFGSNPRPDPCKSGLDGQTQVQTSGQNSSSSNEGTFNARSILPPLPNRTRLKGPENIPSAVSTSKVSFRFASPNPGNVASAPLRADHGIMLPTSEANPNVGEPCALDARHRDWLVKQNAQLSSGTLGLVSAKPVQPTHSSPYQPIDQPAYQPNYQNQFTRGVGSDLNQGPPSQNSDAMNTHHGEYGPFMSESSKKLLSSQRSKYNTDYAKFLQLLEMSKNKGTAEEWNTGQSQISGASGNNYSTSSSSSPCSSPVQFMKSAEIYQRLREMKVGSKCSLRRSASAPQSPAKRRHHLRGAWSEDRAILVRAPLPSAPPRPPPSKDMFQELLARPTLRLATDF